MKRHFKLITSASAIPFEQLVNEFIQRTDIVIEPESEMQFVTDKQGFTYCSSYYMKADYIKFLEKQQQLKEQQTKVVDNNQQEIKFEPVLN